MYRLFAVATWLAQVTRVTEELSPKLIEDCGKTTDRFLGSSPFQHDQLPSHLELEALSLPEVPPLRLEFNRDTEKGD